MKGEGQYGAWAYANVMRATMIRGRSNIDGKLGSSRHNTHYIMLRGVGPYVLSTTSRGHEKKKNTRLRYMHTK